LHHTIEREAKLFEAGSYPERGIEITEEDLDAIIENTIDPPIRIEHTSTPFDGALGVVRSLYRKGRELFGTLCFTRAAWELITSAGARGLSVAINKDKSAIAEVSLVREPRVVDAAVFGEVETVSIAGAQLPTETAGFACGRPEVEGTIDELKRAGKIVPRSETFARAILSEGESSLVMFADAQATLAEVFRRFLEAQPKVIEFAETAPAESACEEPEVYCKLGVTSRLVENYRER